MAELLDGATEHTNYAPLSHGQTMSVGRYLQDQIRQLQQALHDLGKGLGETNDAVAELKKANGGANNALMNLQEGLGNISTTLESQRNELGRTNANVGKLQAGLEGTNGKVAGLIDTQKVNDTMLKRLEKEVGEQAARQHEFKEKMEKRIEADIKGLRDDLSKHELTISHIRGDQDALKAMVLDEKEQLRLTNLKMKDANDRANDMDTFIKILEKRVADNTSGLKSTRMNLEDLNTATLKLHEDHENTKSRVGEQHESIKKAHNHVKQVHNKLEATAQGLQNTQQKLDQQADHGENLRQNLDHALARIQTVTEGNDRAAANISDMKRQLAETTATAHAVRAGLKESNSLLLPNIHLDSLEARHASQRHGSLLMTSNMMGGGLTSPKKTPRSPAPNPRVTQQNWT